jgi:hypothetical protein
MIKLKNILNEQDTTISAKEWRKVSRAITRGMDAAMDKGVRYLRDYERSNLPPAEKKMLSNFWDDYMLLKNRFQKINNHLITKKHLKEAVNIRGNVKWSNPEAQKFSQDAVNKAAKEIGKAQQRAVSIFTSDLKNNKYDNMDLSKAISTGSIKDASYSKREVLSRLFYDIRDRFKAYSRRKNN